MYNIFDNIRYAEKQSFFITFHHTKKKLYFHHGLFQKPICSVHSGLRDQIDRVKESLGGKVQESSSKAEDENELDVRLAAIKVSSLFIPYI